MWLLSFLKSSISLKSVIIKFGIIYDSEKQQILTLKKLKPNNFFLLKNNLKDEYYQKGCLLMFWHSGQSMVNVIQKLSTQTWTGQWKEYSLVRAIKVPDDLRFAIAACYKDADMPGDNQTRWVG